MSIRERSTASADCSVCHFTITTSATWTVQCSRSCVSSARCCFKTTSLDSAVFTELRQLSTLLLQDNKLTSVSANVFQPLVSLTYIDLSGNRLKADSLRPAFLRRSSRLRHVYLDDNQLNTLDSCLMTTSTRTVPRRRKTLITICDLKP